MTRTLGRGANFRLESKNTASKAHLKTKSRSKIHLVLSALILAILSVPLLTTRSASAYSGQGDGTLLNPYKILNCAQLQEMQDNLSAHYELYADINCSVSSDWNSGEGFLPIGDCWGTGFTGSLDGRGHVVSDLFINRPTTDRQSLFGCTANGGTISNLGMQNVDITGQRYAGGIAGVLVGASSSITNSYVTGQITLVFGEVQGSGQYAGGIVSGQEGGSSISNSYSTAVVTTHYPLELFGEGGLVGYSYNNSTVTNSFWDSEASGEPFSAGGGTAKTTLEMKTESTFTDAGWDFENVWQIYVGLNDDYPSLIKQGVNAEPLCEQVHVTATAASVRCELNYSAAVSQEDLGSTTWSARYRKTGDTTWLTTNITNSENGSANFNGLDPETDYELSLKASNNLFDDWFIVEGTTLAANSDVDADGTLDTEENSGPNNGDANNDGNLDSRQANVISYINPVNSQPAVLEAVNCTSITGFQIGSEASEHADADFNYPMGLASFHILCPNDGDTATIRQYFYGVEGNNTYSVRKWMPDGSYREIPGYNLLGIPVSGHGVVFLVEYEITDGGEFDDDGTLNGVIVDPSGPALSANSTSGQTSNGLAETGQSSTFIAIISGILIASSLLMAKRKENRL